MVLNGADSYFPVTILLPRHQRFTRLQYAVRSYPRQDTRLLLPATAERLVKLHQGLKFVELGLSKCELI